MESTSVTPEGEPKPATPSTPSAQTEMHESPAMSSDKTNFDLFVDSVPPGTMSTSTPTPAAAPVYPSYPAPAMPEAQAMPMPATPAMPMPAVQATPMPDAQTTPVVYASPLTAPNPQPQQPPSRRGLLFTVVLLLLAVNGVVIAYRYGLISFPDLTSSKAKSVPSGKGEPAADKGAGDKGAGDKGVEDKKGAGDKGGEKKENKARPFKSTKDVLTAIQDHLFKTAEEERKYQRYFTLAHLHNDTGVSDKQLADFRAGLRTLLGHLQPNKGPAKVEPIDPAKVVLCLDLRGVGWEKQTANAYPWREILKAYPYGILYSDAADEDVKNLGKEIMELSGSDIPAVHLDWFLAAAAEDPLHGKLGPGAAGGVPPAVTALVQRYREPVSLERAARELGLPDAKALREVVQGTARLRDHGLGTFLQGGSMPRAQWSSRNGAQSPFQEAALELNLGTPYSAPR